MEGRGHWAVVLIRWRAADGRNGSLTPRSPAVRREDLKDGIGKYAQEDPKWKSRRPPLGMIPGAGLHTTAVITSTPGSPERFETARPLAADAGLIPRPREVGHCRLSPPERRRQTMSDCATRCTLPVTTRRFNSAVKAHGGRSKKRGKEGGSSSGQHGEAPARVLWGLKSGRLVDASLHLAT
ncbi:MAG: transposase [Salinibacter sp.]